MSMVAEIESAIEKLPQRDQQKLREWLERKTEQKPILQKLRSLADAGKNLPADLASNHDYYLHGTTKRS